MCTAISVLDTMILYGLLHSYHMQRLTILGRTSSKARRNQRNDRLQNVHHPFEISATESSLLLLYWQRSDCAYCSEAKEAFLSRKGHDCR